MRWIESSKELMANPGMEEYYKFMDDADAVVASSQWETTATIVLCIFGVLFIISAIVALSDRKKDGSI